MKSKGNSTKFDLVGSSSYPSSSYWGSTVLTIYERAAFTSTEVFKEEEGEAVLTVLPAAEEHALVEPDICQTYVDAMFLLCCTIF